MAQLGTIEVTIQDLLMLSFEFSPETNNQLQILTNKFFSTFKEVQTYTPSEKESIHKFARISQIGASTRIENALLTDLEVQWIDTLLTKEGKPTDFQKYQHQITDKLSKDRERSIEEVAGCRSMLLLIYAQAQSLFPFTASHLRGLHVELMQYYPPAAPYSGRYKIQSNAVIERNHSLNEERTVLKPADPGVITETAMNDLLHWYNNSLPKSTCSMAIATEFVARFLAIHPFQDGNGRVGRGLFLLSLLQSPELPVREVAKYLAIDRHIEKRKEEYYWALAKMSGGQYRSDPKNYAIEYLFNFMIKVLLDALEDIPFYRIKHQAINSLSETALKILHCFEDEPEQRLTTGSIIEKTGIARRTVINNLTTLLGKGLIQRLGVGRGVRYQLSF